MPKSRRPITVEDLWSLARFSNPTLSPDGRWACVAVMHYSMDDNERRSSLWLLATDGSTQRRLTRGHNDTDPLFSPDGKWIAFLSKRPAEKKSTPAAEREEVTHLYRIAVDGGEAERLSSLETGVFGHRWLADSRRIAFGSWVWPDEKSVKAQNERMRREREDKVRAIVTESARTRYWDHWLPRGRRPHLFLFDTRTDKLSDLFHGTPYHLPWEEPSAADYDFAPDGREVAFTFDSEPEPGPDARADIVVMDLKSRRGRRLTESTQRHDHHPRYAPNGQLIAFLSADRKKVYNDQDRLAVVERATGAVRLVSLEWDRGVNSGLSWSATSDALFFTAEDGVAQPLWRMALTDRTPVLVRRGPGAGGVVSGFDRAADGRMVFVRSTKTSPPAVYAIDAKAKVETALEDFNARLVERLLLSEAESVTVSGHGRDPVQMWVVTPPEFEPGQRWPLLQVIHGGPHTCANDSWHWRWNTSVFAAAGFVVAEVNYHGSTGWGQGFASSINGDWGVREMADIEAGTDFLIERGIIDPDRMLAAGGSYGGYMVAYMNGHIGAGRYQAYVCHAGCYDWVAMMGADSSYWLGRELGAFHWEDEQRVLRQSPHHVAGAMRTPTLVIHGELDYRVPYYQGLAYYNTLKVRHVPARLLAYPDENHWILKPRNSRLWYREFLDWCTRYGAPHGGRRKRTRTGASRRKSA